MGYPKIKINQSFFPPFSFKCSLFRFYVMDIIAKNAKFHKVIYIFLTWIKLILLLRKVFLLYIVWMVSFLLEQYMYIYIIYMTGIILCIFLLKCLHSMTPAFISIHYEKKENISSFIFPFYNWHFISYLLIFTNSDLFSLFIYFYYNSFMETYQYWIFYEILFIF